MDKSLRPKARTAKYPMFEKERRSLAEIEAMHSREMADRTARYAEIAERVYAGGGGKGHVFQRPTVELGRPGALYDLGYCRNIVATEIPLEDQSSHMHSTISIMSGFSCTSSVFMPDEPAPDGDTPHHHSRAPAVPCHAHTTLLARSRTGKIADFTDAYPEQDVAK